MVAGSGSTAPAGPVGRILIAVLGVLGVVTAGLLELAIALHHSSSTVTRRGFVTTTVSGPAAPSPTLVVTCLAAGLVLILVAIFFRHITRIDISGVGEIDLDCAADLAGKVAAKAGGDPAKATALYRNAAAHAAAIASGQPTLRTRIAQAAVGSTRSMLSDDTLQDLVDKAETDYHAQGTAP